MSLIGGALLAGLVGLARITAADSEPKAESHDSLDVRYARAQYQMAEANMRKVGATNQRFPKTVSEAVINEYGEDLAVAKAQLDALQGARPFFAAWVRRHESNMRIAEAYYKTATATNTRQTGSVDPLDLERLRLRVEVTRLQVERQAVARRLAQQEAAMAGAVSGR